MLHRVARVASEIVHYGGNAAQRARWKVIRQDFKAFASRFARIADGVPEGDAAKSAWMISSMSTVWGIKMEGLLSLALRTRGFKPTAIYLNHDPWSPRYHSILGLRDSIYFTPSPLNGKANPSPAIRAFIQSKPKTSELLQFEFDHVAIGRIALSNYLTRNKFSRFDLSDPATLQEIESDLSLSMQRVVAARELVNRSRPKLALLLEKGLSPMAELFGVCIDAGIPVVQYCGSHLSNSYVLKRYSRSNRYQHPFSLDPATWQKVKVMPWSPDHETSLMEEFAEAYQQGSWFKRKFLHQGKQIKSAAEVRKQLGLDPSRKTAVIFSHVLWDATFFYGEGLFENYEEWLLETVKAACANTTVNWIIKLHPDLVWKLKYENHTGELRDTIAIRSSVGRLPDHVKLVLPDTDISSYSFFEITDYCLTVRGTIGIEMACHGVPVITAGTGRYSGLGFTVDSKDRVEYLERIAHIEDQPAMTPTEVELARRFGHALFRMRPWAATTFEVVKSSLDKVSQVLDDNVEIRATTYPEIATAPDLRQFAEWVDSSAVDYFP